MSATASRPVAVPMTRADRPSARRARLGWSGFVFVFITVFLAIGAVNSQNNLLFWVFGLAVAAVIVSGFVSGNSLMGIRLDAGEILDTPVGESRAVPYRMTSRNRLLPAFAMVIREDGADGTTPACVLHIEPRGRIRVSATWTPARRGTARFDRVLIDSRFPFGFIIKTLEFSHPRTALATPAMIELDPALITAIGDGQTEHRIKRARRGVVGSYFGLRAYTPGDPRRLIAWRPSARRSELLVVEHAEPLGRSVWVHLVRPPENRPPEYLSERAIALANAVFRTGSRGGRTVGLWAPWAGVRMAPASGIEAELRAARALALIDLGEPAHADSPPPIGPGDAVITVPCGGGGGGGPAPDRLDPANPQEWLAPGAVLHASLRGPGGAA